MFSHYSDLNNYKDDDFFHSNIDYDDKHAASAYIPEDMKDQISNETPDLIRNPSPINKPFSINNGKNKKNHERTRLKPIIELGSWF